MQPMPVAPDRKILAVDPGGTTGLAYMEDGKVVTRSQVGPADVDTSQHRDTCHEMLYKVFDSYMPDYIVYEEFDYRQNQATAELISKEYIGVIKLWCIQNDRPYVPQRSHQAKVTGKKVFWNKRKLQQVGLWLPSQPHAMDATGHLLYHWTFTLKQQSYLLLLKKLGDVA